MHALCGSPRSVTGVPVEQEPLNSSGQDADHARDPYAVTSQFPTPIEDSSRLKSVPLSIYEEVSFLSKSTRVVGYVKPMASPEDQQRMDAVPSEILAKRVPLFQLRLDYWPQEFVEVDKR